MVERLTRRRLAKIRKHPHIAHIPDLLSHIDALEQELEDVEDMVAQLIGREMDLHALLEQAEKALESVLWAEVAHVDVSQIRAALQAIQEHKAEQPEALLLRQTPGILARLLQWTELTIEDELQESAQDKTLADLERDGQLPQVVLDARAILRAIQEHQEERA